MSVPALIMGGASILGGLFGGNSAKKAAREQAAATREATAEQRRQYDQTRADMGPWMDTGRLALGRLNAAASGDLTNFYDSGAYKIATPEGNKTLGNSFAARGGAFSGNALRALSDYGAQQYGNWWNQQAGLAGAGQSATTNTAAIGQDSTNALARLLGNQGDARASGVMGNANSILGGVNNALNIWASRPQPGQPPSGTYGGPITTPRWPTYSGGYPGTVGFPG